MEERKRVVLNAELSKLNVNEDIVLKQEVLNTNRPIPTEELNEIVDISEVFKNERNQVNCYRFIGNLNIVASNVLFNWDGERSYEEILNARIFDEETQDYIFSQEEILKEENGWFYYLTGDTEVNPCDRKYLEPIQDRFGLYDVNGESNWNMWMTYPSEKNVELLEFNGVPITDGIAIYSGVTVIVDDRVMTAFICSINHGLTVGDEVQISGTTSTGYEGIFDVYALGFGDGTYTNNTFIVDINIGVPPSFIGTETHFKRRVEGIPSEYNGRWFRKFSKTSEIETYNTAFATNIFTDQVYSYNFNKDYDITDFTDYLGRPITEVYISIIKAQDFVDGSRFWTSIESGLKTTLEATEYDINTINTTTFGDSIESDVNNNSVLIFGDIVEYNPVSQTENVLEVAYHRFNSVNREDNNFLEGYYYKPHYKLQIRQFSDYIESAFSGETDVPDYATVFKDGRVTWRDVLPNDFTNSTAIPFLNGCHYIYECINLLVQRQDPCNHFDLGNVSFVLGDCDEIEQFTEVEPIDICGADC